MNDRLTVVMYHYVRNIKASRYPNIKGLELSDFIDQISFFKKNYSVVTMEQVLDAVYESSVLPDNALLLTFDDAYAEHFNHVYPVLKKNNIQGSFYAPAKTILEHEVLDVNKIHFVLSSVDDINILVVAIEKELEKYSSEYDLLSFDEYYAQWAKPSRFDNKNVIFVKRMLQHALPEELRNLIADRLFTEYVGVPPCAFAKELYMDVHQLEHMIKDGMHIGCHGYDHYWWNRLDSHSLENELVRSKDFMSQLGCNMEQWTACYPYGSQSENVVEALANHGCKLAFTTEVRHASLRKDGPLLLPRLDTNDFPPKSTNYLEVTG